MQVYHPTKGARIPLLNSDNRKAEVLLLSLYYHYLLSPSCYWLIRITLKCLVLRHFLFNRFSLVLTNKYYICMRTFIKS